MQRKVPEMADTTSLGNSPQKYMIFALGPSHFFLLRKLVFFKVEMSGGGGECLCVCVCGCQGVVLVVLRGPGGGGGPRQGQVVVSR